MFEFRWINLSSVLILVLQFTAVTGTHYLVVRVGDDVTLPCEKVINDQNKCDATTWLLSDIRNAVELITLGQIGEYAKSKSDRLSVKENCSLVIKKVTDEDVGFYTCRQFNKSGQQLQEASVHLFVINMTEQKHDDRMMFTCSVSKHGQGRVSVKWMYEGKNEDKDIKTPQPICVDTLTFPTSDLKPNVHELLKCKVRDIYTGKEQLFTFSHQTSDEKTTNENSKKSETDTTVSPPTKPTDWWVYVIAAVGFAVLIITVVVVIRKRKTKGNKTKTDKNAVRSLKHVVIVPAPEITPDTIDPEDDLSYGPISFNNTSSSKAQRQVKDDDGGDTVTYSTVKTSSVAVSTDPNNLYATIYNPKK